MLNAGLIVVSLLVAYFVGMGIGVLLGIIFK
jgi:hypothetical protein